MLGRRYAATALCLGATTIGVSACGSTAHPAPGEASSANLRLYTASGGATAVDVAVTDTAVFAAGNFRGVLDGATLGSKREGGFVAQAFGSAPWQRTLDGSRAVAVAGDSNQVVVASVAGDSSLGPITTVVSYRAATGEPTWTRQLAASGYLHARDVAIADGITYVVGEFAGVLKLGDITLRADGLSDGFVVALGDSGRVRWARRFGGLGTAHASAVATHGDEIVVAGTFSQLAAIGSTTVDSNDGSFDIVLISLRTDGTVSWARSLGGPATDSANAVAFSAQGIVVLGSFEAGLTFNGKPHLSKGASDIALARYRSDGKPERLVTIGSSGTDLAAGAAFDGDAILVSGELQNSGPGDVRGPFLGIIANGVKVRRLRGELETAAISARASNSAVAGTLRGRGEIAGHRAQAPKSGAAFVVSGVHGPKP